MSSFIDLSPLNDLSVLGFNIFSAACLAKCGTVLLSTGVEGASVTTSGSGVVTSGAGRRVTKTNANYYADARDTGLESESFDWVGIAPPYTKELAAKFI